MNGFAGIGELERWQDRAVLWTAALSLLLHAAVLILGSALSAYFPPKAPPPVVEVELTEPPLSTLPEEKAPPPAPPVPAQKTVPAKKTVPVPAKKAKRPSAQKWLRKLDAALPVVPDAPVRRGLGKTGGLPVRRWVNDAAPRPGDFAPAVAPENAALRRQIANLEGKLRRSGTPAIGTGKEIDASVLFGGVGSSSGAPIPEWIREMIRNTVRGYLPELEQTYSAAFRRHPGLAGRLVVRFRIDPSGRLVDAQSVRASFRDADFVARVLAKMRGWTFRPTGGRTVDVVYPFVFVAPS